MNAIGKWVRGVWIVLLVAAVVIGLDQATKEWVRINIPKYSHIVPIPQLGQAFVFEHVDNFGAAFGILKMHRGVFIGVAVIVAVAILVYAPRLSADQKLIRVILGLQMGGALGNVVDRLNHGNVTDFLDFHWRGQHWPAFNVADIAICIGVLVLIGWTTLTGAGSSDQVKT